jgi:acetoin utilization deacetylase AcuC-like enzyme
MLGLFPYKDHLIDVPARDATSDEIAWIHSRDHIRLIESTSERSFTMLDPDTGATADSSASASRAVGGALVAVDMAVGEGKSAFAFVRPPGHHAEAQRAMGFCLFNNIAVAAQYALKIYGLARVLIVDWDVHHGNGTMHSFYESDEVLYFSIHEYPYYPGTGRITEVGSGAGEGFTVNVPLAGGEGNEAYRAVFRQILRPIARSFAPELILVSAGFDAHRNDPMAYMELNSSSFGEMAYALREIAGECGHNRIACVLEGGYDLAALEESTSAVLIGLLGQEQPAEASAAPDASVYRIIEGVLHTQNPYWNIP